MKHRHVSPALPQAWPQCESQGLGRRCSLWRLRAKASKLRACQHSSSGPRAAGQRPSLRQSCKRCLCLRAICRQLVGTWERGGGVPRSGAYAKLSTDQWRVRRGRTRLTHPDKANEQLAEVLGGLGRRRLRRHSRGTVEGQGGGRGDVAKARHSGCCGLVLLVGLARSSFAGFSCLRGASER